MDIDDSKNNMVLLGRKLNPAIQAGVAGKIISKMSYFGSWIFGF